MAQVSFVFVYRDSFTYVFVDEIYLNFKFEFAHFSFHFISASDDTADYAALQASIKQTETERVSGEGKRVGSKVDRKHENGESESGESESEDSVRVERGWRK